MHLRVDLEKQLTREIVEFEEARKMPYITSVERFAVAVGGPRQDQRPAVAVGRGLWPVAAGRRGPRLYGLPAAALEKLAKALLRFQFLDDLHDWLAAVDL